jgi:PKD repeat protein
MLSTVHPGASPSPFSRALQPLVRLALLASCALGAAAGVAGQTADFSMTPIAPTPGSTVTLSYSGACPGALTSITWEFGDTQSITQDPNVNGCNATHAYASAGIYRVRLTVSPSGSSLSRDLGVLTTTNGQNALHPAFTYSPSTPAPAQPALFADDTTPSNSVGQWTWEFDDGSKSYIRNPEKSFPAGIHGVRLTVRNQADTEQVTLFIEVLLPNPPTAAFSFTPTHPTPGTLVQFLDASTESPTAWAWNFGDPTSSFPNTSTEQNPTRRYSNAGTFTVRLIASNAGGPSTPHTEVVTVGPIGPIPVASFTYSPAAPVAGDQVLFTDTSSGSPTSWSWNFDDPASGGSNTSTLRNPSHVFGEARSYNVTLRATNGSGTSDPSTQAVAVAQAQGTCQSNTNTLCLQGNRFSVTAAYRTNAGATGFGQAIVLTADSGYFYFFDPNNVEVVTKVLNACVNPFNSYWVFAAGLTNVEVTLTVTDTSNGTVKAYHNPLGTPFQPIQDTSAFATCP